MNWPCSSGTRTRSGGSKVGEQRIDPKESRYERGKTGGASKLYPGLVDFFARREAAQCLEPIGEVTGDDETCKRRSQVIVIVVMAAPDVQQENDPSGRLAICFTFLEPAVRPLDLTVGPWDLTLVSLCSTSFR